MLPPENVRDYPRPPVVEPVAERLSVILGGQTLAETRGGFRVLETHHAPTYYIPAADVAPGALQPAGGGSVCEWKGRAAYFDVRGGGIDRRRAAWCYPSPTPAFGAIAGYVAFYAGRMDRCLVGDTPVLPQAGDFYGGWVTPNLTGTIKGGPGTEFW